MSAQARPVRPVGTLTTSAVAREVATLDRPAARAARQRFRKRVAFLTADFLLVNTGFLLAYYLRYTLRLWPEVNEFHDAPLSAYYLAQAILVIVLLALFARRGLYAMKRTTQWLDEVGIIASGTSVGISVLVMIFYVFRPGVTSRAMLLYAWAAIIFLLSVLRLGARWMVARRRARGDGLERVLVVGAGHMGKMVMQQIATRPGLGYTLVGFCDDVAWSHRSTFGRFSCLGNLADLTQVIAEHRVDEVVLALPSAEHQRILDIFSLCESSGVGFQLVPDTYDMTLGTLQVDNLAGIPLIGLRQPALHGFNQAVKRVIDVVVASLLLLAFAPMMLLVALAVRLESKGPVFLPQERVGIGGRVFRLYKIRSMYHGADQKLRELRALNEASGPIFKMRNDPRRTKVGRFIRKTSLDEVPQLWSVLKGDMSLVGPRPPFPHEVEQYEEWARRRLDVTPGLTGLWQVNGRSDLPFDEMVMLDLYYIENWSLGLDLKVILQTIPAVISGRGAY